MFGFGSLTAGWVGVAVWMSAHRMSKANLVCLVHDVIVGLESKSSKMVSVMAPASFEPCLLGTDMGRPVHRPLEAAPFPILSKGLGVYLGRLRIIHQGGTEWHACLFTSGSAPMGSIVAGKYGVEEWYST